MSASACRASLISLLDVVCAALDGCVALDTFGFGWSRTGSVVTGSSLIDAGDLRGALRTALCEGVGVTAVSASPFGVLDFRRDCL